MTNLKTAQIPDAVKDVAIKLRNHNFEAYIVGGAVRDMLLNREPHDWDVATNATPDKVMSIFGSSFTVPTGLKHGTVTVLGLHKNFPGDRFFPVEVTTYRTEGTYSDGRHPDEVRFAKTIQEDLSRRDFTMNAIAYDPLADVLVDPFNGQRDISYELVRAVGNPAERFAEDGLRCVRAIRQAVQLDFRIEENTYYDIFKPTSIEMFQHVSKERVRDELLKMLSATTDSNWLWQLHETGLLAHIIPELDDGVRMVQNKYHNYDVFDHTSETVVNTINEPAKRGVWRLGALLHDVGKPATRAPKENAPGEFSFHNHEHVGAEMAADICSRLKLSTDDKTIVVNMVKHHMFDFQPGWSDAAVRRFVRKVGPEMLDPLYALRFGDRMGKGFPNENPQPEIDLLKSRIEQAVTPDTAFTVKNLAINGSDVIRLLNCKPGKIVGDTLAFLLEKVIDSPELNTAETLTNLVLTNISC